MPLLPTVRMLLRYDNDSLLEEVTGSQFLARGNQDIELDDDGQGLVLKRNQFTSIDNFALGVTDKFSLGFWLFSKHPGAAVSSLTGDRAPMRISVLDFGVGAFDSDLGDVVISTQSLLVHETAEIDGTMTMAVELPGFVAETESYDPDLWHYFWIAYDGSSGLTVIVDGAETTLVTTGTLPASISGSAVAFSINRLALTPDPDTLNHNGTIDDVVVLNEAIDDAESVQKVINFSIDHLIDSDFAVVQETDFSLLFDDPTPLRVTDMTTDRAYLYASRNDGRVLRGSSLLWETRRDFVDAKEADFLGIFNEGSVIEDGFLKVTNGMVRL